MIKFTSGPHGQLTNEYEMQHIIECLHSQTFRDINHAYNNYWHFSNTIFAYDIGSFLADMDKLIHSQVHTLRVIGSVHKDPGHASGLIGYWEDGKFRPAWVQDTYVRFKVELDANTYTNLCCLDSHSTYHYLIDYPVAHGYGHIMNE